MSTTKLGRNHIFLQHASLQVLYQSCIKRNHVTSISSMSLQWGIVFEKSPHRAKTSTPKTCPSFWGPVKPTLPRVFVLNRRLWLPGKAACTSKQRSKGRSFGRSYKPFSFEPWQRSMVVSGSPNWQFSIYRLYTTYILPFGGLYATYHL